MKMIRSETDHMIACLRERQDKLCSDAADTIERMRRERLLCDKRIHNQRAACRITWEIVEMRRKWMGHPNVLKAYGRLLKRYRALLGHEQLDGGSDADTPGK